MKDAMSAFMEYAAAFEETYADDDWSRLAKYFPENATYEVRGGPLACKIAGRDEIFAGLKKSIDGLDRRCSDRQLALTDGPHISEKDDAQEISIRWTVTYQYGDAPQLVLPGGSVFTVADGLIVAMRDEYDDKEMESVGAWMQEHGQGLDGSYL